MSAILVALLVCAAANADQAKPTTAERLSKDVEQMVKESRAPAEAALKELQQLATPEDFKSLGFEAHAEVQKAELGKPLPVILVRLDELREYKKGDDPYKLLHPIPKVMYAVNVNGQARSGVEVEKRDGKWEASAFGKSASARQYAESLKQQAAKDKARMFFIVKVAALNRTYLAYQTDQGARLIEVRWDDTKAKIESRPAADVLAELVKLAKEHDGDFR